MYAHMREVISIMWLLQEAADQDINFIDSKTKVHCTFYEDNAEAIKIAKVPKVQKREVIIYHEGIKDQKADTFTKPKEGLFNEFKNQDDEMVAAHSISVYYEMRESEYTLCTYTTYGNN
jgi:hypothetical protein